MSCWPTFWAICEVARPLVRSGCCSPLRDKRALIAATLRPIGRSWRSRAAKKLGLRRTAVSRLGDLIRSLDCQRQLTGGCHLLRVLSYSTSAMPTTTASSPKIRLSLLRSLA